MEIMKSNLSAVVIAKNEEPRIAACLESLQWADEILLVDNGSTDKTADIARKHKARIIEASGKDFSGLRTIGAQKATNDWILYIDADEEVPPGLKKEIEETIANHKEDTSAGYFIERDTYYLGYHWPTRDRMERLFLKSKLMGWHGELHEAPQIEGNIGVLAHPLIHRTHRTLEEMITKTNEWSRTEAVLRFKAHHPTVVWWRLLRVMWTGFARSYFSQGGWRAGTVGWIESIYQAFSMFITYAKLWELQQKKITDR